MSTATADSNIPLGPKDNPNTLRCGYCNRPITSEGFCSTGCAGIDQRLKTPGLDGSNL